MHSCSIITQPSYLECESKFEIRFHFKFEKVFVYNVKSYLGNLETSLESGKHDTISTQSSSHESESKFDPLGNKML